MFKAAVNSNDRIFLNKRRLMHLKTKAIRSGVWFKILQRIDRVLFDITIRVVDNIRSTKLAKSLLTLTKKIENGMKSDFSRSLVEIGLPIAQKISFTAQKLGNISASFWVFDSSFVIFLAVMHINNVKVLRR